MAKNLIPQVGMHAGRCIGHGCLEHVVDEPEEVHQQRTPSPQPLGRSLAAALHGLVVEQQDDVPVEAFEPSLAWLRRSIHREGSGGSHSCRMASLVNLVGVDVGNGIQLGECLS